MVLEFLASHLGIAMLSALLFACSIVAAVVAASAAASSARSSQSAQELAAEMRRLTAQVEALARAPARADAAGEIAYNEAGDHRDGYGLRARQEAEAIVSGKAPGAAVALADHHLEAAKKAAIEPSALLRNRVRRK